MANNLWLIGNRNDEEIKTPDCGDFENDSYLSDTEKEYLRTTSLKSEGSRVLKTRMKIDKEIPQYLPMFGQFCYFCDIQIN